jgi:hypothetical protein
VEVPVCNSPRAHRRIHNARRWDRHRHRSAVGTNLLRPNPCRGSRPHSRSRSPCPGDSRRSCGRSASSGCRRHRSIHRRSEWGNDANRRPSGSVGNRRAPPVRRRCHVRPARGRQPVDAATTRVAQAGALGSRDCRHRRARTRRVRRLYKLRERLRRLLPLRSRPNRLAQRPSERPRLGSRPPRAAQKRSPRTSVDPTCSVPSLVPLSSCPRTE